MREKRSVRRRHRGAAAGRVRVVPPEPAATWQPRVVVSYLHPTIRSSLVLSFVAAGEEVEWKKLDAIWSLAADHEAVLRHIRDEVGAYLAARRPNDGGGQ